MIMGENGIFEKANTAKEKTIEAQAEEDVQLKVLETQASNDGKFTYGKFMQILNDSPDEYIVKDEDGNEVTELQDDYEGDITVINRKYNIEVGVSEDLEIKSQGAIDVNEPEDYTANLLYKTDYPNMKNGEEGVSISNGVSINKSGNYASFDTSDDYISVDTSQVDSQEILVGNSNKTVTCWYRASSEYANLTVWRRYDMLWGMDKWKWS